MKSSTVHAQTCKKTGIVMQMDGTQAEGVLALIFYLGAFSNPSAELAILVNGELKANPKNLEGLYSLSYRHEGIMPGDEIIIRAKSMGIEETEIFSGIMQKKARETRKK